VKYLYPRQILYLHDRILEASGGSPGLRDEGLLESAVFRPRATFGGQDLYADLFSKTAALGYSLINNHPFIDGNKRTGFESMRLMLRLNGHDLIASEKAKYAFVLDVALKKLSEQEMADWLMKKSRPFERP